MLPLIVKFCLENHHQASVLDIGCYSQIMWGRNLSLLLYMTLDCFWVAYLHIVLKLVLLGGPVREYPWLPTAKLGGGVARRSSNKLWFNLEILTPEKKRTLI